MACKNVTNIVFLNTIKVGLNWSLEAALLTTSRFIYKMLVACASDN